ncbi:MAG: hypothetical protein ACRD2J_02510 [Thermoanaerobaculia bacterium]
MSASAEQTATTYFLVGIVPYFDLLDETDAAKATRFAARMQQVLGEAALLADGVILDSLGSRFVARFATAPAAVDALRLVARGIAEQNEAHPGDPLEPAVLADCDDGAAPGGGVAPSSLAFANRILGSMEPGQVLMTASLAHAAGVIETAPRAGSMAGIDLYGVPLEPAAPEQEQEPAREETAVAIPPRRRRLAPVAAIAAAGGAFAVVLGAIIFWPRGEEPVSRVEAASTPAPAADTRPAIHLAPFASPSDDAEAVARATALEEAVRRMLAGSPDVRVMNDASSAAVRSFGLRRVDGEAPGQLVVFAAGAAAEGPRVSLEKPGEAAGVIARWIAGQSGVAAASVAPANEEALSRFVEAVAASRGEDPGAPRRAATAALAAMTADPEYLPAARLALALAREAGDEAASVAAAQQVVRLDPEDLATRKSLVEWLRADGRTSDALRLLRPAVASAADRDLVLFAAREALSAGDEVSFRHLLPSIARVAGDAAPLHAPDLLVTQGRLGLAASQYYEIERAQPSNAALALKIGRIAALRHSMSMAELELRKLEGLDPGYGAPLLRAFIAAERGDASAAAAALDAAAAGAGPQHDFHTASAEVHAILGDHRAVLASLRQAVDGREPSFAYILSNPLFAYLGDEATFRSLRERMFAAQKETREALATIR